MSEWICEISLWISPDPWPLCGQCLPGPSMVSSILFAIMWYIYHTGRESVRHSLLSYHTDCTLGPIMLKWQFKHACPVRMPITSLSVCRGNLNRSLSLLRHLSFIISFVCQHVCISCQHLLCCLQAQSYIAIFITICEIGSDGSGPVKVDSLVVQSDLPAHFPVFQYVLEPRSHTDRMQCS